jgi:hypothetical protein
VTARQHAVAVSKPLRGEDGKYAGEETGFMVRDVEPGQGFKTRDGKTYMVDSHGSIRRVKQR